jgi:sulfide:quinone oxidoreductase
VWNSVALAGGGTVGYDQLVMAPGLQLDFEAVPGLAESVGTRGVSSNYRVDLAPRTWDFVRAVRRGTAIFTMPAGPIKCGGAPQKIAYLAADWWRRQGLLDSIRIILVLPTATIFSQPDWAKVLGRVAADYGIEVRYESQLAEVDGDSRQAVILDNASGTKETVDYELLHAVPPQSAPDWLKGSALADPESPFGYLAVDRPAHRGPQRIHPRPRRVAPRRPAPPATGTAGPAGAAPIGPGRHRLPPLTATAAVNRDAPRWRSRSGPPTGR